MTTPDTEFEPFDISGEFNFDAWMDLYKTNPEEFERQRSLQVQSVIEGAPEDKQPRLNGLQFQVDMERRRSKTPMQACVRISGMMHESLCELNEALNGLQGPQHPGGGNTPTNADILEFKPK